MTQKTENVIVVMRFNGNYRGRTISSALTGKEGEAGMKKDYIVELSKEEADELMDEHWVGELVRCKDCRWGDRSRNRKGEEMIFCYNGDTGIEDGYLHEPNWFCAEGERRTDE